MTGPEAAGERNEKGLGKYSQQRECQVTMDVRLQLDLDLEVKIQPESERVLPPAALLLLHLLLLLLLPHHLLLLLLAVELLHLALRPVAALASLRTGSHLLLAFVLLLLLLLRPRWLAAVLRRLGLRLSAAAGAALFFSVPLQLRLRLELWRVLGLRLVLVLMLGLGLVLLLVLGLVVHFVLDGGGLVVLFLVEVLPVLAFLRVAPLFRVVFRVTG